MVTRDRLRQVAACLRAIANQTVDASIEVCIVNDGGQPVQAIAEAVRHVRPMPVKVLDLSIHLGQSAARNKALALAEGEFVAWCDDDDRWLPDHLSALLAAAQAGPCLAYTDAEIVWMDETPHGQVVVEHRAPFAWRDAARLLRTYNPIVPSSVLYPRRLHEQIGGIDESVGHYWDWDLWLRAQQVVPISRVPTCLTLYRVWSDGSNTSADTQQMRPDLQHLCDKHQLGTLPTSNFGRMTTDLDLKSHQADTRFVWDGDLAIW